MASNWIGFRLRPRELLRLPSISAEEFCFCAEEEEPVEAKPHPPSEQSLILSIELRRCRGMSHSSAWIFATVDRSMGS